MEYEYKAHTITMNAEGMFVVTHGVKTYRVASLALAKKKIDELNVIKFEPFKALEFNNYGVKEINVVDVVKQRGGYHYVYEGADDTYRRQANYVTPDTPENRAAINEYVKAQEHYSEEMDRLRKVRDEAYAKIGKQYPVGKE